MSNLTDNAQHINQDILIDESKTFVIENDFQRYLLYCYFNQIPIIINYILHKNPNITWKFVKQTPFFNWDYTYLSANPNITTEIMKTNNHLWWNKNWYLSNSNISLDEVLFTCLDPKMDPNILLCSPCLTFDIVKLHKNVNWNYPVLTGNDNITWNDIIENKHLNWNYEYFSSNKNLNIDILRNHPELKWNTRNFSKNSSITWNDVISNPQIKWDYDGLSANTNITMDIVMANQDKNWNYNILSTNINITWDIMLQFPNIKWNTSHFTRNPNITWKILCDNKTLNWTDNRNLGIYTYHRDLIPHYDILNYIHNNYDTEYDIKLDSASKSRTLNDINPLSGQEPIWASGIDKGLSRNILRVNHTHTHTTTNYCMECKKDIHNTYEKMYNPIPELTGMYRHLYIDHMNDLNYNLNLQKKRIKSVIDNSEYILPVSSIINLY